MKLFKNVIANIIIGGVVITTLIVSLSAGAISVSGTLKPIYKGSSSTNVSLMVNVYWGTEFIDPMLEIFEANNMTTTFFVGGTWVAQNEDVLTKIYDKGHEIGNHGYYHKDHKTISDQRNREEIEITHKLVKEILNVEMNLFAPPSGSFNDATLRIAESLGYKTIMWTYDTIDWRDKDKTLIFNRAVKNLSGGNLILMHPTKATVEALPDIIKAIKDKGLVVTPVSEALSAAV